MIRTTLAATMLASLALPALAAGTGDAPPPRTKTTLVCPEGYVYDEASKLCVAAQSGALSDDQLIGAARELAYAGRPAEAVEMLSFVRAETADVLTVKGFATRKAGDWEGGVALYRAALALDPDHLLARSYLGQGMAERNDTTGAREQLRLIRAAGGAGTWAERSLAEAIETGRGYDY